VIYKFSLYIVLLCASFFIASCSSDSGGGGTAKCTTITEHPGEPDLTGIPSFSPTTVTAGQLVTISVPLDADVANIHLVLESSYLQNTIYVQDIVQQAVTPGVQTWQYVIDTTGFTPGSYFADLDLCTDPNNCSNLSTGIGIAYFNTSISDPTPNYMRGKFWDNGSINSYSNYSDACIKIPFVTIN